MSPQSHTVLAAKIVMLYIWEKPRQQHQFSLLLLAWNPSKAKTNNYCMNYSNLVYIIWNVLFHIIKLAEMWTVCWRDEAIKWCVATNFLFWLNLIITYKVVILSSSTLRFACKQLTIGKSTQTTCDSISTQSGSTNKWIMEIFIGTFSCVLWIRRHQWSF